MKQSTVFANVKFAKDYSLKLRWTPFVLVAIAAMVNVEIALNTPFNFHPDEIMHADAICYFESHWWPPPLNSDEILYSPDGWSRVYNGEIVYLIYGKLSALTRSITSRVFAAQPIVSSPPYSLYRIYLPVVFRVPNCIMSPLIYRLFNVGLLTVTLFVLFLKGRRNVWLFVVGLIVLCIPQVLYIYAYANSDAWGLSISLWLFLFVLTTKARIGSPRYAILLGLLVGLLLLCKLTFWLSLSWYSVLVGAQYFQQRQQSALSLSFKQTMVFVAILFATILLMIAPIKLIYPLGQGDWDAEVEQMREIRAWNDFKPSVLTRPGYRLAAKGESIIVVLNNRHWFETTLKSFYGIFGHLNVVLPSWIYIVALGIFILNMGLTIGAVWSKWSLLNLMTKALIISAPFSILLNIAASLYNSWVYDFQPQGRYLFSSLVPFVILLAGTVYVENKWSITLRVITWLASYVLCTYVLVTYVV